MRFYTCGGRGEALTGSAGLHLQNKIRKNPQHMLKFRYSVAQRLYIYFGRLLGGGVVVSEM